MMFKKFTWNWRSILLGFHYGKNPASGQRFLHIGLGPFLGIDFEFPPYELNEQYNASHVNTLAFYEYTIRTAILNAAKDPEVSLLLYGEPKLGHSIDAKEAERIWKYMDESTRESMFRSGRLIPDIEKEYRQIESCLVDPDEREPGAVYRRVQETLLELRHFYGVAKRISHEDADNIAQWTLGEMYPMPGETPDEFDRRSNKAEESFRKKYPQWRG